MERLLFEIEKTIQWEQHLPGLQSYNQFWLSIWGQSRSVTFLWSRANRERERETCNIARYLHDMMDGEKERERGTVKFNII